MHWKTVPLSVEQILALDEEYRRKVRAGEPDGEARAPRQGAGESWLSMMLERGNGTQVTVSSAPTVARRWSGGARSRVKVCWKPRAGEPAEWTVVTERQESPLRGQRTVRGREGECQAYYEQVACNRLTDQAIGILKAQLGYSDEEAYRAICGQASGRGVLLVDVADVIVSAGDVRGRYPQIFDEVQFDRRPWYLRRDEMLAKSLARGK